MNDCDKALSEVNKFDCPMCNDVSAEYAVKHVFENYVEPMEKKYKMSCGPYGVLDEENKLLKECVGFVKICAQGKTQYLTSTGVESAKMLLEKINGRDT